MQAVSETVLQELRMRYNAAYTAYQACVRAVSEATMSGSLASPGLREREAEALSALNKARATLMAAMAGAAGGQLRSGR